MSIRECKKKLSEALNTLYLIEDNTNYDIESLGKAINLLQDLDIDKEYKKYNQ